jgi:uncharacterized protein YuzE
MAVCTHYDPKADAAWIYFRKPSMIVRPSSSLELDDLRLIAYDAEGKVLAVEILDVSKGVDLDGLPGQREIKRELRRLAGTYGWGN